jgi:uncharacterized protein (DUF58 family)
MFIGTTLILSAVVGLPVFEITSGAEKITVKRSIDKKKIFAKDFLHITLTVKNEGRTSIDFMKIDDAFPKTFKLVLGKNSIETRIAPNSTRKYSYIIQPRLRGEYRIGPTRLQIHDRLGFHFVERKIQSYTDVLIYPPYEDIRKIEAVSKQRRLGIIFGMHKTMQRGMGTDFFGIRQYTPSDSLRYIEWKSSARSGELKTREFETEKNIRVVMFLDTSGSMSGGLVENSKLEYAIRAVVLLTKIALERRDLVSLITYTNQVKDYIEPKMGKRHFYTILDTVATVQAGGGAQLKPVIQYVLKRIPRASLYIILTDLEGPKKSTLDAIKLARASKNKVLIITPFGPWFERRAETLSPVDTALTEVIAAELSEKRKLISNQIKKMGVEVINVGPDDILPIVISTYMKAKHRGKGAG